MRKVSKIVSLVLFSLFIFGYFNIVSFAADTGTILPQTQFKDNISDCEKIMNFVNSDYKENVPTAKIVVTGRDENNKTITAGTIPGIEKNVTGNDILGCAIMTGDIKLWMVPFFIRYILEFIIGIAGLVSVGAVIYGGYLYLFAGISDDKDKGKNAIKNGIIGLVLILTAWAIVNIVISLVTF